MNIHARPAQQQTVQMVSKSYAPGKPVSYVVLIAGRYFRINGATLDYLYEGKTPEWCGLEPIEEDE